MARPLRPGAELRSHRGGLTGCLCPHGLAASPHELAWMTFNPQPG